VTRARFRDGGGFESVAGYARAARHGEWIAVSGTGDVGPDGAVGSPGDTYAQTRRSLERALDAVERLGGRREDVVRTRLYLVPGADWRAAVRAHRELLTGVDPANTTLFVAGFVAPEMLVEVEVDAFVADVGS
jgi:enamine deaminase RidA (YjgF/YER057c/UK114 family)